MRPFIIGVGGSHSGAGKTRAACGLLCRLSARSGRWGALKFTPSALYSSVSDGADGADGGKDTDLMLRAGASEALWVRSSREDMAETLGIAMDGLLGLEGVVVEGNSAIEVLAPDIVIFISGDPDRSKRGSERVLRMADLVVFQKDPPEGVPGDARLFSAEEEAACLDFVIEKLDERKGQRRAP